MFFFTLVNHYNYTTILGENVYLFILFPIFQASNKQIQSNLPCTPTRETFFPSHSAHPMGSHRIPGFYAWPLTGPPWTRKVFCKMCEKCVLGEEKNKNGGQKNKEIHLWSIWFPNHWGKLCFSYRAWTDSV